jgi:hypothetical protein
MAAPDPTVVYEVCFTNAINGASFTDQYGTQEEAEHAARTEWPFNNTRTVTSAVSADGSQTELLRLPGREGAT